MKKSLLILALLSAGLVQAQVTTNLGATSDYRFRGISQTQLAPAIQGGIDYSDKSGVYIGNWNSSVSSQMYTNGAGLESDLYAGYKKEILGVTVDVGSYNYLYPKAAVGSTKFDTSEVYVGVTKGPLTVKASQSLNNYFGAANSQGTRYYQADVTYPIAGSQFSLFAHAGRTDVANSTTSDYNDYNFGIGSKWAGYDIAAKYYTNSGLSTASKAADTINGQKLYKNAAVLSVSKTF
jgi:uncharacterized protein (TIGR02001 family)